MRLIPSSAISFFIVFAVHAAQAAPVPFASAQTASSTVDGARSIAAGDFDQDGDLDLVAAGANGGEVVWLENTDGAGSFGAKQVISSTAPVVQFVSVADVDSDGRPDVISASDGNSSVTWYRNIGGGAFLAGLTVSNTVSMARSAIGADVDGYGDTDLVVGAASDPNVVWFENQNGSGVRAG